MIKSLVKKILLWKQKELKVLYIGDPELNDDWDYSCLSYTQQEKHYDNSLKNRRDIRRIKDATDFHTQWIRQSKASIKSPFSDNILNAEASYIPYIDTYHCIIYKFFDKKTFYLMVGDYWYEKIGLYIPEEKLIILKRYININVKEMLSLFQMRLLIARETKPIDNNKISLVLYHDHLAHHIMNELNGIQELIDQGLIDNIDKIYYCNQPFGNIIDIFSEIPSDKFCKVSRSSINKKLHKKGQLLLPYQTAAIDQKTIVRLKNYCTTSIEDTLSKEIDQIKNRYDIRIWCSIRTDNRILANMITLLKSIVKYIEREGKSVILIIDGYSKAYESSEREDESYPMLIAEEKKLIANIKSIGTECIGLVGRPIQHVISYTATANCYLCHSGTLHHKISWFRDIPGIIHSNEHFSELPDHLLPGMTEVKWKYIPQRVSMSHIKDTNTRSHSRKGDILSKKFSNYKVDVDAVTSQFIELLNTHRLVKN